MATVNRRGAAFKVFVIAAMGVLVLFAASMARSAETSNPLAAKPPAPVRMSLPEAKRAVRMMDDIYFNGVLTTHAMYVQDAGTASAITWAKQVIRKVRAKGWPEARIFDTTSRPMNPDNLPADAFERDAGTAFRQGKNSFEKVDGDTYRYASSIHAVDQSCLTCHVRSKVGDLLGGVSYRAHLLPKSK